MNQLSSSTGGSMAWVLLLGTAGLVCLSACERIALVAENRVEVAIAPPERPQAWATLGPLGYRIMVPPSGGIPGASIELPARGDRAAASLSSAVTSSSAATSPSAATCSAPTCSPPSCSSATCSSATCSSATCSSATGAPAHRAEAAALVRLIIPKRLNLPLLAYPVPEGCERTDLLRPAGAVFPYSLSPAGRLVFRYEDGFLADLLTAVCSQGELLSAVNVPRLRAEIIEKAAGDAWTLDRDAILETLVYATMRSSRIRLLERHSFDIPGREGEWVWGNPLQKGVTASEGVLSLVDLPVGTHNLFHTAPGSGVEDRILLQLDDRGWQWLELLTGSAGSGSW